MRGHVHAPVARLEACWAVVQVNGRKAVSAALLVGLSCHVAGAWQAVDDSLIGADLSLGLGGLPGPLCLNPLPADPFYERDPHKVHRFELVGLRGGEGVTKP